MNDKSTNNAQLLALTTRESPFGKIDASELKAAPPAHTYGAASMQTYANGQVAYNTHASADGFLAYVNQFEQTSFRVKDGQVQWWQYNPSFDDWQDNYGCDSVEVYYHAGHGGMDSATGTFFAPLGGTWDGRSDLSSADMSIGDQRLRYLFLATCDGCMVFPPNNPARTWNVPNRGMRMLFGATNLIFDDPNYGTNLWNHWRTGSSFSQAWQDALLDAGSGQQPSATACGSSAADAQARLFNERFFDVGPVARDWYWWRWVGTAPALAQRPSLDIPKHLKFARVSPAQRQRAASVAALHRLGLDKAALIPEGPTEQCRWSTDRGHFSILPGGGVVAEYYTARAARSSLTEKHASEVAAYAVGGDGLRLAAVLPAYHAGGRAGGETSSPEVYEHIVIHRQEVAGLPIVAPGVGEVRTYVDHSGSVRRVVDTRVEIEAISDHGPWPTAWPMPDGRIEKPRRFESIDQVTKALETAVTAGRGSHQVGDNECFCRVLPESIVIGHSLQSGHLLPVARAAAEFGKGRYRMLQPVEIPLIA